MKNCFRYFYPVAILAILMVAEGTVVAQEDITTVDDSVFEAHIRPSVVFNHEEHNENAGLDCYVCHHVYDDDGQIAEDETSEGFECSECHGQSNDSRNLEVVVKYHQLCKGCHEQEEAGPVVCCECHVK